MADFNVSLQAPQGAGANPVAPVQEQLNPFFALAETVIDQFGKNAAADRKAQAEAAKQATLTDYSQKIGAIEDGLLSGELDPTKANLMRRKIHSQYAAAYPQYIKEIKEVNSSFRESGAIGEAIQEEQAQQDREKALLNKAAENGLVVPKGADQSTKDSIIAAQQANDRFDTELARLSKVQQYRVATKTEQREDDKIRMDAETDQLLTDLGNAHTTAFGKIVETGVRHSWDGRNIDDIILNAQQYLTNVRQTVNVVARNNPAKANAFMSIMEEQFDFLKKAKEMPVEDAKRQLDLLLNKQALMMAQKDPKALNLAALSKLNIQAVQQSSEVVQVVDRLLNMSQNANTPGSMEIAQGGPAMAEVNRQWGVVSNQKLDAEGEKQRNNMASGVLRSMALSTTVNGMDSTKFNAATDFLASEGFRNLWMTGQVSPEDVSGAERAYQKLYAQPVSLAIQNKLTQGTFTPTVRMEPRVAGQPVRTSAPEARPYSDYVEYQMIGESLVARPKIDKGHPVDVRDSQRISEDLRSTTEYLNKIVAIGATLSKSPTKQAFWEMHKHEILPDIYPDPQRVQAGKVYEMDGKKFKYLGGTPWKNPSQWEEVKDQSSSTPNYGNRPDGTKKGTGYLGELKVPGSDVVATEYSVGVNIGGKEMDIPTIVPTLTKEQKDRLLRAIGNNESPPEDIVRTAVEHAKKRLREGKSVFAN